MVCHGKPPWALPRVPKVKQKGEKGKQMKKLIIALSAIAMAVAANAASLNWATWGFINDGSADSDWISGGQAYLVMVDNAATFAVADDLSVTGGAIVDNVVFDGGSAGGTWNDTASLVDGTTYLFAIIGTSDGTGATVPTTGFYGVDRNGDNATASGFYEVVWNAATGGSLDADGNFAGFGINTAVAPEPTSGLLLLLGMAGLALRRKRA